MQEEEGVEVVRSPRAGGLSILTDNEKRERTDTLATTEDVFQEEEMGQEATLVEAGRNSPKTALGSIFKPFRKSKSRNKKTNIILPPQIQQINLALVDERRQEANQKADYARRLLETAFRPDNATRDKDDPAEFRAMKKEDMIDTAFKYAVEARQLRSTNPPSDENLQEHRDHGAAAAHEALRFMMASKSRALLTNLNVCEEDDGSINGGVYTPQDIEDAAGKYSEQARSHMEQILSPFEKKITAPAHIILNKPSTHLENRGGEDITLSTLGFDNTFQETSPTKEFSLSSLNEILDEQQSPTAKPGESPVNANTISPLTEADSKKNGRRGRFRHKEEVGVEQPKIKPGTILVPFRRQKESQTKGLNDKLRQVVADSDENSEISEISELESIRALETKIDAKLKKAAANDDGEFSLVDEESLTNEPKFISAPSFDPDVMSLENWDNLIEGGSLDDILAGASARKGKAEATLKKRVIVWRRVTSKMPGASENRKADRKKKKANRQVPPQSFSDTDVQDTPIENMKIIGLESSMEQALVSAEEDELPGETKFVATRESEVMSSKKWDNSVNVANGQREQEPLGIIRPPKWRIMSWGRRNNGGDSSSITNVSPAITKEEFGDKYTSLAEVAESTDEEAVKRLALEDPIVSDIDMLPNRGDPELVRAVFSAEDRKVDSDDANKIDFAPVEVGADNGAETTQKALMSRDAVIQNIYADRKSIPEPPPVDRSTSESIGGLRQGVEPSSSFMEMINIEKIELIERRMEEEEKRARIPKGLVTLFGRRKGKNAAPPLAEKDTA